jgi:uncharacterized membrane protein
MPRKPLLSDPADLSRVAEAVGRAEQGSAGEVRVQLEPRCAGDPLDRARELFAALGMEGTERGTGVLLYAAPEDRKAAVFAGEGLFGAAEPGFWDGVLDALAEGAAAGSLADGLVAALDRIGGLLRARFPAQDGAGNELPDAVEGA